MSNTNTIVISFHADPIACQAVAAAYADDARFLYEEGLYAVAENQQEKAAQWYARARKMLGIET